MEHALAKLRTTFITGAFFCTATIDAILHASLVPMLPQKGQKLQISQAVIGGLFAIVPGCVLICAPPLGFYAKTVGIKQMLVAGLITIGVSGSLFGLSESLAMTVISLFGIGFGAAIFWSSCYLALAEVIPTSEQTTVFGLVEMATGIGCIIGAPFSMLLAEMFDFSLPFILCGLTEIMCIIPIIMLLPSPTVDCPPSSPVEAEEEEHIEHRSFQSKLQKLQHTHMNTERIPLLGNWHFSSPQMTHNAQIPKQTQPVKKRSYESIPTTSRASSPVPQIKQESFLKQLLYVLNNRDRFLVMFSVMLCEIVYGAINPYLSSQLQHPVDLGGYGLTSKEAAFWFSMSSISYTIIALVAGKLASKINPRTVVTFGMELLAIGVLLFGTAPWLLSHIGLDEKSSQHSVLWLQILGPFGLVIMSLGQGMSFVPTLPMILHSLQADSAKSYSKAEAVAPHASDSLLLPKRVQDENAEEDIEESPTNSRHESNDNEEEDKEYSDGDENEDDEFNELEDMTSSYDSFPLSSNEVVRPEYQDNVVINFELKHLKEDKMQNECISSSCDDDVSKKPAHEVHVIDIETEQERSYQSNSESKPSVINNSSESMSAQQAEDHAHAAGLATGVFHAMNSLAQVIGPLSANLFALAVSFEMMCCVFGVGILIFALSARVCLRKEVIDKKNEDESLDVSEFTSLKEKITIDVCEKATSKLLSLAAREKRTDEQQKLTSITSEQAPNAKKVSYSHLD